MLFVHISHENPVAVSNTTSSRKGKYVMINISTMTKAPLLSITVLCSYTFETVAVTAIGKSQSNKPYSTSDARNNV